MTSSSSLLLISNIEVNGTRHRCRNVVQDSVLDESVDGPIVDCCISLEKEAHETISLIAKRACVLRETYLNGRETVMTMVDNQPTVLQTAERTKAKRRRKLPWNI